ncbi:ATP-grasp domain-containing protein [Gulosibacter sediminis]|uniref:ATP-binding protein n=1 Tax=Gulosibacter sediminis TaxID=1729695 RepID=UPI0024A7E1C6|nr:ATP-grasp domain-containing protein [Gulosibacter sediminis]
MLEIAEYVALTRFVKDHLIEPEVEINSLKITHSGILRITRGFKERGWSVLKDEQGSSRHSLHTLTSPDGNISLSMVGGKVFRHGRVTEQICGRKHLAKRMLERAQISIPVGADFAHDEMEAAMAYFEMLPKPIVVKPVGAGGSHGVTVGVTKSEEFLKAWKYALAEGGARSRVLLEQFVPGVELRPYVVGDDVVSIVARVQPFVIGDGHQAVWQLVDGVNLARSVNYRANAYPVVVDWSFVERQGVNSDSILGSGEVLYLSPFCYPTVGAFIVDVTEQVHPEIIAMAVAAKNAIPGLEVAGVDILTSDIKDPRGAYVVEVNTAAALDMHRYPTHGDSREICDDIVEYFHRQYLSDLDEA